MKKIIIIISLLIIGITLFILFPKKSNKENINIKYYKNELKDRYNRYRLDNPELSLEDVVTRVNLNLDKKFYDDIKEAKYLNTPYVLVNKYNYLDVNYVPKDLVKLDNCTSSGRYLVKEAKESFDKLCEDITSAGLKLRVISSYRSYNYQKVLYDNYVLKDGIKLADTYSARPGFSEHQTGLVIDIDNYTEDFNNFENTKEFEWMINNSYKYGFILRYPYGKENITGYNYESWHFRYVGKIANYIYQNDLTFDEYYVRFLDK